MVPSRLAKGWQHGAVPDYRVIAALGSSFAAGPGIAPVADVAAMRSERNYAHQLADRLGARLVDLTVSGATTANVLDTPQQIIEGVVYPPQLDGVPDDADVVTITAGGNDLQFAGAMLYAAWQNTEPESPIIGMLKPMFPQGIALPADEDVERATTGLVRVIEKARGAAPRSRIFLVDYLTVLDRESASAAPFTGGELETFLIIQSAIETVFSEASSRTGAELLRASALSTDHALGSAVPWVQPFYPVLAQTGGSSTPTRPE